MEHPLQRLKWFSNNFYIYEKVPYTIKSQYFIDCIVYIVVKYYTTACPKDFKIYIHFTYTYTFIMSIKHMHYFFKRHSQGR
jgi:hypothetical protein